MDHTKEIATEISIKSNSLRICLEKMGLNVLNSEQFDTITIQRNNENWENLMIENGVNLFYRSDNFSISIDETTTWSDLDKLIAIFNQELKTDVQLEKMNYVVSHIDRKDSFLNQKVFNNYHSETEMMRYVKKLENKDLSLVHAMISLGSCTMKLNAATEMEPITWPSFCNLHPFAPVEQTKGYQEIFDTLIKDLSDITGFDSVSLQPNSGAQGEYSGLMVIRAFHIDNNEGHRNICLIPNSAHGTNPASAVMAGMEVVLIKCDEKGNVDLDDLKNKAEVHRSNLAALMITYPTTHGVFEEEIKTITNIVHENGGQVYI